MAFLTSSVSKMDDIQILIDNMDSLMVEDTTKKFMGYEVVELDYEADAEDIPCDITDKYVQLSDEIQQQMTQDIMIYRMEELLIGENSEKTHYDVLIKIYDISTKYLTSIRNYDVKFALKNLDKEMIKKIRLYLDTLLYKIEFDIDDPKYSDFDEYDRHLMCLLYNLIYKIVELMVIDKNMNISFVNRLKHIMIGLTSMCNIMFYILQKYHCIT